MTTSLAPLTMGSRLTWPFWISLAPLIPYRMNGSYGVRGILNDWVRGFLSGRTMTLVVDGEESAEPINVLLGVPQGTVLAPYYSLCILMTPLIKCPQVLSVEYFQMTACYTGPYTHWRTSSSCSVIVMHFRVGKICGVCSSIRKSATSCTFAELRPQKWPFFLRIMWHNVAFCDGL